MKRTINIITFIILASSLSACSVTSSLKLGSSDSEIGMVQSEGKVLKLYPGNPDHQQIWIDYIDAHNARDLEKIAAMNAPDWKGFAPDGTYISGTEAQIEFLDEWFKSGQDPKWEIHFMVANDSDQDMWLTTGNDVRYLDEDGKRVMEHHVHDVQIEDGKIRQVKVYVRAATNTPAKRLDDKLKAQWAQGKPEGMLSCYEEDAIELFPQTWAGFFGHENILSRYQAVFGEGSVAIGSKIEGDPRGYSDLGDGFFIYDAVGKTISTDGEILWNGQMAILGRETDGDSKIVQFMAHSPIPEDANFLPPNPEQVNELIASLPVIELVDAALAVHFDNLREAWQSHDVDMLMEEFCDDARLVIATSEYPVRGHSTIRAHFEDFMAEVEQDSVFKKGGTLDYLITGYQPINDRHIRAFGAYVVRNAEGDPVFIGGFGNVYRRDGDRLQILMNVDSPVPFPTAEEWEEMQDAEAATQEG